MKFAYTIIYVADVPETVAFYETAFGLSCRMMHPSNQYAEMETGGTALAFADEGMAKSKGFSIAPNRAEDAAAGIEVAFVSDDVAASFAQAVDAGASPI
ncbi:MAG: VOC family protein, partial [Paracoccaceae bacterium]